MLDFNNILATPGADIQYFSGPATTTLLQWQTWRKPRGARWIHMIGVGGGGGGSTGAQTGTTGGGAAGGSSGGQTTVMIPAMFLPDILYIQCGAGGAGSAGTVSGSFGSTGTATYVTIEPVQNVPGPASTLLLANGGTVSATAPTTANGGLAPGAVAAATLAGMCLAGRGFTTLLAGQVGGAGGAANTNAPTVNLPATGLMVTAGSGGGGCTGGGVGGIIGPAGTPLGTEFFPSLNTTQGDNGTTGPIIRHFLMNYGGVGGYGALNAGNMPAFKGGDGSPGCGGGGAGGSTTSFSSLGKGGNGGAGFVYIITT